MLQVVILAAGRGERFSKEGYVIPKPLILARGKPMIQYALEQAAVVNQTPIVLCPADLKFNIWGLAQTCVPRTIGVSHTQSGAAMTMLAAAAALSEQEPVLTMDCDSIISLEAVERFATYAQQAFVNGHQSTVMCFTPADASSRYSFVRLAQTRDRQFPTVVEVVEKTRISDMATTGVHAFSSWRVLREAICQMVQQRMLVNGEYYIAPVHNYIDSTAAMLIESDEFTAIGTPEQLEAYEQAIPTA